MLRMGCTAFGGPAAHVAMLREEVVIRRSWLSEQEFLDLLSVAGLIPGPTSTELAIHLGMRRAGLPGLLVAGVCFITPAVLITVALAWAYVRFGRLPAGQSLLWGMQPAVLAVVLHAVFGLTRTALKRPSLNLLAVAVLVCYLASVNELVLLLGAGMVGVILARPWRTHRPSVALLLLTGLPGAASTAPMVAAPAVAPLVAPTAGALFLYFLKVGSVLFGSGYVLLAFLRQGLVHDLRWLTEQQLVDAIAAGQFTPGPLFSTAAFVGYVAGGWSGAVAASAGIFLPSFFFVWATHGVVRRLREAAWTAGFLDGLNAGSLALMAGVWWQLAHRALLSPVPDPLALGLTAAAALLAFTTRLNSAWLVLGGALVGAALRMALIRG